MDANFYVVLCYLVLTVEGLVLHNPCGTLTVMKPAFMNRNVTLKFIPQNRWISNIVWKYALELDTRFYTLYGWEEHFRSPAHDGIYYNTKSFVAYKYRNNSKFHVQCNHENTISNTVKLHLNEIRPICGNLVRLSPEIKYGQNVEIAYYPSDTLVKNPDLYHERTWLNGVGQPVHFRNDTYKERKMSDYLYTLNIHNFMESKAGRYALKCGKSIVSSTNWLDIHVTDKQLIGPIWDGCVYGNAETTIYCNTSRTTGKTRVTLSIGSEVITMLENETQPGVYTVVLDANTWRDNDGHIVTCKVSNDDYIHDLKCSAKLFYTEKGSDPILNMPEYIHDENTTVSCEVSNARPPASIEILVDNQAISEAVKTNLLDEASKTFASKALILNIDKEWNGKKICCRRFSIIYGNMKAPCKTLDIKLQTQPSNIPLYNEQNGTQFYDSTTGKTVILNGSSMNDTHANGLCSGTKCTLSTIQATQDVIIKVDKIARTLKFLLRPILIGTGAFVVLCIFIASARTLVRWHKVRSRTRDPDNTNAIEAPPSLDTNEYVEMPATSMPMNASHDLEDDHVEMRTQEDSVMVRKPVTAAESMHGESSLIYADRDIDHLQQASVGPIRGPRPTLGKGATVYEDIDFSNTKPVGLH